LPLASRRLPLPAPSKQTQCAKAGGGFIKSLARPGGNITGFTQFEYSLAAKWMELLKQIAPQVTRTAVIRDPTRGTGIGQFAVTQAIAPSRPNLIMIFVWQQSTWIAYSRATSRPTCRFKHPQNMSLRLI